MKLAIIITALVAGASAGALHGRKNKGNTNTGATTGSTNSAATGDVQRGTSTLVLKEVNGVPGNECLTFRNNGRSNRSSYPPIVKTTELTAMSPRTQAKSWMPLA